MLRKIFGNPGFVIVFVMAVQPLFAQNQTPNQSASQPSPAAVAAGKLFQEQKWSEAAAAYEALTKAEPQNGQAWYRLGASLNSLNQHEKAVAPLQKAVEILRGPVAMYTLGSTYAQLNDKEKAFTTLSQAVGAGFGQANRLQNDPNLASLRNDPRFAKLVEDVRRNSKPCEFSEKARAFDFWIGEWDVQLNGQTVGVNVITKSEDGCSIHEHWTNNGGNGGRSINFYNATLGIWRQSYIGSNMAVWEMSGEVKDGKMQYTGQVFSSSGTVMTKVNIWPIGPDRLRHTQDDSSDGGKTWTNVWDSTYVRRAK